MSADGPRLMIYSQDGLGLGHMRRTSVLAQEFLRRTPHGSVLTLSDSPLGQFFATAAGHDFLKLPSIRKTGPGEWEAVSLGMSFDEVLQLRSRLIASAIASFDPHVLLVDHMPHGAMGELIPALRASRRRRVRVVLGLRDILDAPHTVQRRWTAEGAYEALEEFYDDVLVYGQQDVLDVAAEYSWPVSISQRTTYTGYVCTPTAERVAHREPWEGTRPPQVVVIAGGGADAYPMFSAVLDASRQVHADTGAAFRFVTGPFMPERDVKDLKRRANGSSHIDLRRKVHNGRKVARGDLVVSMAGYNTSVELLSAGTPTLLIPRSGPSAEQRTRAELFADRSWVQWHDPSLLHPDVVAAAMIRSLTEVLAPSTRPKLDGRETAARLAHAHEFIQELAEGYDTVLGERGSTLSGGQRQRIAIARAFIRQAPVLVLDEPTTGLDPQSAAQVIAALRSLIEGRTTIIISHDLDLVRCADRIVVLDDGRIVQEGTPETLAVEDGLYADLFHRSADEP